MTSHVLIRFVGDYADEFAVYGFCVLTKEQWAATVDMIHKIPDDHFSEVYFGTNEFMSWDNAEDFLQDIEVKNLTEVEASVFKMYFSHSDGTIDFGHTFIDQIFEQYRDEEGLDDN